MFLVFKKYTFWGHTVILLTLSSGVLSILIQNSMSDNLKMVSVCVLLLSAVSASVTFDANKPVLRLIHYNLEHYMKYFREKIDIVLVQQRLVIDKVITEVKMLKENFNESVREGSTEVTKKKILILLNDKVLEWRDLILLYSTQCELAILSRIKFDKPGEF